MVTEWKSSHLKSADYDSKAQRLDVGFHDGSRWRYWGVTPATWSAFEAAKSKGRFFREAIRDGHRAEKLPKEA